MGSEAPLLDIAPENLVEFETEVKTIPQYDPANPQMISQGPSVCIFNKTDPQVVLASWLFAQFLLTNEVQIAYAETEGYVPVTLKAQQAEEYIDYLARSGEDNTTHYDVKIKASQLLVDNVTHTFTTPVFNGSTSLRDAAGQLIESVAKSVRRGQTIDEAYMEKLYSDTTSLYRLDQIATSSQNSGSGDLGPLPKTSKALLITLGVLWVGIAAVYLKEKAKKKVKAK